VAPVLATVLSMFDGFQLRTREVHPSVGTRRAR
jgi:hypothetical protein